ncbi:MAG: MFS transporter [Planctomycetaceae bacterium]|nr:MFS transporter [Planctomycetaceae bacterium]
MNQNLSLTAKLELMGMLFLHGMAMAAWFVPMASILDAANLDSIKPFAFAASALATILSPLFFGALADRSVPPIIVLRWVTLVTAAFASLVAIAIHQQLPSIVILLLLQVQAIFAAPTSSLSGAIVFARLGTGQTRFGAIRSLGTIGWIVGCWATSLLSLDQNPNAFFLSAGLWCGLFGFTWFLPSIPRSSGTSEENRSPRTRMSLRQRLGLDALGLLRDSNHRVVYITAALLAIPFAAFYPYTPRLLADLNFERISAWMSLGQASEVLMLLFMAQVLHRHGFKRIVCTGIFLGVVRYSLYAVSEPLAVLSGVALHGMVFTFTYISTQIYLAERIDPAWQVRAQALLSFMSGGVGNLIGYLAVGGWLTACDGKDGRAWPMYWGVLACAVLTVFIYFTISFRSATLKSGSNAT